MVLTNWCREVTQSKSRVYRELQDHLGVRGVQTFVYRGAATQLERLANYYMTLIADGNLLIKLSLEGERISKEVCMPSSIVAEVTNLGLMADAISSLCVNGLNVCLSLSGTD